MKIGFECVYILSSVITIDPSVLISSNTVMRYFLHCNHYPLHILFSFPLFMFNITIFQCEQIEPTCWVIYMLMLFLSPNQCPSSTSSWKKNYSGAAMTWSTFLIRFSRMPHRLINLTSKILTCKIDETTIILM